MRNFCFNSSWVRNVNFSFSPSFLFTFSPFIIFIFQMNLLWDRASLLRKINFVSSLLFLLRCFFHRAHKISKWIGPVNNLLIFILWVYFQILFVLYPLDSLRLVTKILCVFLLPSVSVYRENYAFFEGDVPSSWLLGL